MATLAIRNVTKNFGELDVLRGIDIEAADGEFLVLLGPSGCGKSTLLNAIAGLEAISGGDIVIDGDVVTDLEPKQRDIAMVFQSYALYPHMTVRENIAFPLTLAKMKKADIAVKVEQTAKTLDLTDLLDRKPGQLSGGQRQRVAMGRAIVRNPKAFLMDEPLSNLDAKLRVQMRTEIARLQHRLGTTTVYVTHDQTEAMTLGDRVVVMRGGQAQQVGTPDELYNRPANLFVAGFIGSPAMNFFPAYLTDVGIQLPFGEVLLAPDVYDGLYDRGLGNLIVGVRPEHLADAALLDAYERIQALIFDVEVDLVDSLGSDKYVHFSIAGAGARAAQLTELAQQVESAAAPADNEFVARVSADSRAVAGRPISLALDTAKLVVFDADSGTNLTAAAQ